MYMYAVLLHILCIVFFDIIVTHLKCLRLTSLYRCTEILHGIFQIFMKGFFDAS